MDPISIALSLAKFAPDVIKWVTGDDKSAKVAEKVVDIAKVVTGNEDAEGAVEAIKADPTLAAEFQKFVIEHSDDMEKAYLADVANARSRDAEFLKAGKRNIRADVMFGLAVAVICALVWVVWKDPAINEYVKGIFTLVLGRFLGYLDNIYNFEFGSTRGSQNKDATIKQLTR